MLQNNCYLIDNKKNCYLIIQHATVQFYQYNCTVASLQKMLKLLAYETPHESCFWVFGKSNAKYLTFGTPNGNALSLSVILITN